MSEKIDSSDIEVLKGLEPVRRRPAIYLGDLTDPNLNTRLALQTICHAIDETLEGNCHSIKLFVSEDMVTALYDVGLPLDPHPAVDQQPAAIVFLALHMGCHNQKKNISVGSELCEIGLATLNGVSSRLVAKVSNNLHFADFIFEQGVLRNKPKVVSCSEKDYTEISVKLDPNILPTTSFNYDAIKTEAERISAKYKFTIQVVKKT